MMSSIDHQQKMEESMENEVVVNDEKQQQHDDDAQMLSLSLSSTTCTTLEGSNTTLTDTNNTMHHPRSQYDTHRHHHNDVEYEYMMTHTQYYRMIDDINHDLIRYQYIRNTSNDEIRFYFEQLIQNLIDQRNELLLCMDNNNLQYELYLTSKRFEYLSIISDDSTNRDPPNKNEGQNMTNDDQHDTV